MMKSLMVALVLVGLAILGRGEALAQAGKPDGSTPAPQLLNVAPSGDETFAGKGTDHRFPRELAISARGETRVLKALGSGMRKKLIIKVYEGVAYAEAPDTLGADPYTTLIDGNFPKRIEMYFVHDVDGGKIRGAFEDGFKKTLPAEPSRELKAAVDTFLSYFPDRGVKDGQTIALTWMPGYGLYTRVAGAPSPPIDNEELARALWAVWFGSDPVNDGLKRDMVRFATGEE